MLTEEGTHRHARRDGNGENRYLKGRKLARAVRVESDGQYEREHAEKRNGHDSQTLEKHEGNDERHHPRSVVRGGPLGKLDELRTVERGHPPLPKQYRTACDGSEDHVEKRNGERRDFCHHVSDGNRSERAEQSRRGKNGTIPVYRKRLEIHRTGDDSQNRDDRGSERNERLVGKYEKTSDDGEQASGFRIRSENSGAFVGIRVLAGKGRAYAGERSPRGEKEKQRLGDVRGKVERREISERLSYGEEREDDGDDDEIVIERPEERSRAHRHSC